MNKKQILKVLIFLVIVIIIGNALTDVLRFRDNDISKLKQYYEDTENKNFDFYFIGSSHIYSNINTRTIDNRLGVNTYDMALGSLKMSQAYYLLQEAMKYDDIDVVVIEMFSLYSKGLLRTQMKARVSENMKWSKNKIDYLINVFGFPDIFDQFFPLLRYHNNYSEPEIIVKNLETFGESLPINKYYYHGYAPSNYREMTEALFKKNLKNPTENKKNYTVTSLDYDNYEDELHYLHKIIALCQDHDIEIIMLKTPVISFFGSIQKYADAYCSTSKEIAAKYKINAIDYNFLANALNLDHTCFLDVGHLNSRGASIVSSHFANYYKAIHNKRLHSNDNYINTSKMEAVENRGLVSKAYDELYSDGLRIEKIYTETNYNMIAKLGPETLKQPGMDYLPYTFSCIVKNVSNVPQEELKQIFTLYNGKNGCDKYQYRTVQHIKGDYYKVTTSLESNIGKYFDVRVNSKLPQNMPIEIYQLELKQDFY